MFASEVIWEALINEQTTPNERTYKECISSFFVIIECKLIDKCREEKVRQTAYLDDLEPEERDYLLIEHAKKLFDKWQKDLELQDIIDHFSPELKEKCMRVLSGEKYVFRDYTQLKKEAEKLAKEIL